MSLSERNIGKNASDAMAFYWLGIARFQLHDAIGATMAFRTAEKLGQNSAKFHEALGLAYYDLNQFFLFEQQMESASKLAPKDFAPRYFLGLYRLSIKSDTQGALRFFREAVELNPTDWKSLYQEGYCLELSGDSAQARLFYSRSMSEVERNHEPFGWPFQGMARMLVGENPQQALRLAQEAVRIEPQEYSHHMTLAKAYAELRDLPNAISEAKAAESLSPNLATVRYLLMRWYRQAGDLHKAEAELQMFQKLNAVYGPE
jgi:Flp pilus assembly protein TadD